MKDSKKAIRTYKDIEADCCATAEQMQKAEQNTRELRKQLSSLYYEHFTSVMSAVYRLKDSDGEVVEIDKSLLTEVCEYLDDYINHKQAPYDRDEQDIPF